MQRSPARQSGRIAITIARWLLVVVLAAVSVSALSNIGLPTRSQMVERLSDVEKARLAEMFHLRVRAMLPEDVAVRL